MSARHQCLLVKREVAEPVFNVAVEMLCMHAACGFGSAQLWWFGVSLPLEEMSLVENLWNNTSICIGKTVPLNKSTGMR